MFRVTLLKLGCRPKHSKGDQMSKHRKEALTRGRALPIIPLMMGGVAFAGGAAMLLSGAGGTSPLAAMDSNETTTRTVEYSDSTLVDDECSFADPACALGGLGAGFDLASFAGSG